MRVPGQPSGSEATRAETRSITLAALHARVVEDILRRSRAGQWLNRRVLAIRTKLEANSNELETRDRAAIPRAVVRDVHGSRISIELAVDGCRVWEQSYLGRDGLLVAGVIAEGAVGCLDEEVADLEGLVGEVGWLPDCEAGWVSVPVVVGLGDVAHVVDLLAGIVVVDVYGLTVDGTLEVITAVLDTPEPVVL